MHIEEKKLPPQNAFYSNLKMKDISDHDYERAEQVWNTMENMTEAAITTLTWTQMFYPWHMYWRHFEIRAYITRS